MSKPLVSVVAYNGDTVVYRYHGEEYYLIITHAMCQLSLGDYLLAPDCDFAVMGGSPEVTHCLSFCWPAPTALSADQLLVVINEHHSACGQSCPV